MLQTTRFETYHAPATGLPQHRHVTPYAAVVVEGAYLETSVDGVYWCVPGCIVLHPAFHAHANQFPASGARVLNLVLNPERLDWNNGAAVLRIAALGPFRLARLTTADLLASLRDAEAVAPVPVPGYAGRAALLFTEHPEASVADTARRLGVSREHLAREFRRTIGLTAVGFRIEQRLRRALKQVACTSDPLTRIAYRCGFADHAHLTRTIRSATGLAPSELRRRMTR